jgi:hypothetical protein
MSKLTQQFALDEIDTALGEVGIFLKSELNGPVRYYFYDVKEEVTLVFEKSPPMVIDAGIHILVLTAVSPFNYVTHYGPEEMLGD